jgi:hypothetical protein
MAIGVGFVTKVVTSLLQGGVIDELLSKKLEDIGEDFIRSQLSGPLGALGKFADGGEFDFAEQRDAWLNKLSKSALPSLPNLPHKGLLNKVFSIIEQARPPVKRGRRGNWRGKTAWARSSWARSRNDWLDNHWKHDWRSQPRNPITGQWMPGRLEQVDAAMTAKGKQIGRRTKRRRKLRRQARTRGRKAARKMFQRLRN